MTDITSAMNVRFAQRYANHAGTVIIGFSKGPTYLSLLKPALSLAELTGAFASVYGIPRCLPVIYHKATQRQLPAAFPSLICYHAFIPSRLVKWALPNPVPMVSTAHLETSSMKGICDKPCTTASLCIITNVL